MKLAKLSTASYAHAFGLLCLVSASSLSSSVWAFDLSDPAQRQQARAAAVLGKFDLNKDQQITLQEVAKVRNAEFDSFDKDKDGKVTVEDYQAFAKAQKEEARKAKFKKMDVDKDARLSYDEYRESRKQQPEANVQREFVSRDKDGDEALNEAEFLYEIPSPFGGGNSAAHQFRRADKNRDGTLLREEYAHHLSLMARMDKNRNRILTKEELLGKDEVIRFGPFADSEDAESARADAVKAHEKPAKPAQ